MTGTIEELIAANAYQVPDYIVTLWRDNAHEIAAGDCPVCTQMSEHFGQDVGCTRLLAESTG